MKISELLEAKHPIKILDLRYEEPSDPTLILKHWGSHPKEYIAPSDGFFWHWHAGKLILHSERNDIYSWKMVQLLKLHAAGVNVTPVDAWLKTPAGKKNQPFELWNMLNGKVSFNDQTVLIHKEHAGGSGTERQRIMSDIKELQSALKALQPYGVTGEFKIKGVPPHVGKTVNLVLSQIDPTSQILGGGSLTMYHGTSTVRWDKIQKAGLQPGHTGKQYVDLRTGYSENNVYLATNPKVAEFYAKRQAGKDGDTGGVILSVEVPDPALLLADDEYVPPGQWSDKEQRVLPPDPRSMLRRAASKVPMSLSGRGPGSFAYKGRIPPSNIKLVRTVAVSSRRS